MRLTRIMIIKENELKEIIKCNEWTFKEGTSWSGEECEETFEVAEHFSGIEVFVNYECSEKRLKRPENWDKYTEVRRLIEEDEEIPEYLEEYANDEKCNENLDEYLNKEDWKLTLKDIENIRETIKEGDFESWLKLHDTGYVELDLI